jgi:hypothetical protein
MPEIFTCVSRMDAAIRLYLRDFGRRYIGRTVMVWFTERSGSNPVIAVDAARKEGQANIGAYLSVVEYVRHTGSGVPMNAYVPVTARHEDTIQYVHTQQRGEVRDG